MTEGMLQRIAICMTHAIGSWHAACYPVIFVHLLFTAIGMTEN
jgi:hypothetical protein